MNFANEFASARTRTQLKFVVFYLFNDDALKITQKLQLKIYTNLENLEGDDARG